MHFILKANRQTAHLALSSDAIRMAESMGGRVTPVPHNGSIYQTYTIHAGEDWYLKTDSPLMASLYWNHYAVEPMHPDKGYVLSKHGRPCSREMLRGRSVLEIAFALMAISDESDD